MAKRAFTYAGAFSGIGMLERACELMGGHGLFSAEKDEFCRKVLKKRMPHVEHLPDVGWVGQGMESPDVVVAGFPCQDISSAGRGKGITGKRSGLWFELLRIVKALHPKIVLIENVALLRSRGLDLILVELRMAGYDVEWDVIPAAAVGAPHLRERIWIVARRQDVVLGPVFGDESGDFRLDEKFPRAGRMNSHLRTLDPVAPRKTKRKDGWSYWVGVNLVAEVGEGGALLPSPTAHANGNSPENHMRKKAERCGGPRSTITNLEVLARNGFAQPGGILYPTATATANDGRGGRNETAGRSDPDSKHHSGRTLSDVAFGALWPTATSHPRTHTPRQVDHGAQAKRIEQGRSNLTDRMEIEAPGKSASLNPTWVEWLMGIPLWWTDLDVATPFVTQAPWLFEPEMIPRVAQKIPMRRQRLTAIGNSCVWPIAAWVLDRALATTNLARAEDVCAA